jgi:2-oxoglutarate dehydrogenase E2 component (dihydrolipoamide succinyltransferase)
MPTELAEQLSVVVKKVEFSPDYIPAAAPVWPAPGFVAAAKPVADAKPDAKPKRVLSEEHLAKMKAGREAAKLKKQLAAAAEPPAPVVAAPLPVVAAPVPVVAVAVPVVAEEKPKRVLSPEHLAKLKAGREAAAAKKAASLVAAPLAVPEPVAVPKPVAADVTSLMAELERLRAAIAHATTPVPMAMAAPAPMAMAAPVPMAAPAPSSMMVVDDSLPESEAEAEAEPVVTPPVKKRVLSPEHLAKMKAGRAAKKAEKAAAAMAAPTPVAAVKTKTA